MARLRLTLLGGFEARLASGGMLSIPARKTRALLTYLALRPGLRASRDALAALLWGDRGDAEARQSLRQALAGARRAFPRTRPAVLVADHDSVALSEAVVEVDARRFERLAATTRPAALREAVSLYRGDLLEGLRLRQAGYDEWLESERERLRGLAVAALERLSTHRLEPRDIEAALQAGLRFLALDGSQEAVHRALMRLYLKSGRRAAAVKQYTRCVEVLRRELGVAPDAATQTLHREAAGRAPAAKTLAVRARPATRAETDARLVGRAAELAELRRAFEGARQGQGALVTVSGEAGIGKSRLIRELAAWAATRDARIVEAHCFETEQILPFAPWVGVLRHEHLEPALRDTVEADARARTELTRLLPELGRGSAEPIAEGDYLRIFEAVSRVVLTAAARQPLLLVLEDLHWADDLSVRLADFLGRRCGAARLLLVGTMRDEEVLDRGPARRLLEADGDGERVALRLTPLSKPQTLDLVRQLAGARTAAAGLASLGPQVWRLSEGNPFMVVETMRAIPEAPQLDAMERLPLADRIRQLVLRRLDRLSERSRSLAGVAAVIGREIDPALLRRAAGVSERALADRVDELTRRRVLHAAGDGLAFTHDYIREVTYADLHPPRKRLLHATVARALEAHHAGRLEPHWTALGAHHREAGAWQEAASALRRAAVVAVERGAYGDAGALYDQAITAVNQLSPTRDAVALGIDLRLELAIALEPLGEFERIATRVDEAERAAAGLDDEPRLAWAAAHRASLLWQTGRPAEACAAAARARETGERLGDHRLVMTATFALGVAHALCGRYRLATTLLEELSREVDLRGEPRGLGMIASSCRSWLAFIDMECGAFERARPRAEAALRLAEARGHTYSIGIASWVLGMLHLNHERPEDAVPVLERALAHAHDSRIANLLPIVTALLRRAREAVGRTETVDPPPADVARFCQLGTIYHASQRITEASTHLAGGRVREAGAAAEEALASARAGQLPIIQASALRTLGVVLSRRDPPDDEGAEARYREALALAEALGTRPVAASVHLRLGTLYRHAGKPALAEPHLVTAHAMFTAMGMRRSSSAAEEELRELSITVAPKPVS